MPEAPNEKAHPHPAKARAVAPLPPPGGSSRTYAELQVTSNFTFLTGASHPDELVQQAASLGYAAIALTDTNSLAGVVRAHSAAKDAGIPFVVGCRLRFVAGAHGDAPEVMVYPTDRAAYGRLCRLLTLGKRRAPKGECHLSLHDLIEHSEGLLAVIVPPVKLDDRFIETVEGLRETFREDRLSLAAACLYETDHATRLRQLADLVAHTRVPLVAVNDVHYHTPGRRALQDALVCVREGCTVETAGFRLLPNAERHLKPPEEMGRLFAAYPEAIRRGVEIAERASGFSLGQLRYEYPDEVVPTGSTPMQHLAELTARGVLERYPNGVPDKVRAQIDHELKLIDELNYAPYFLTVHDLVAFAKSQRILCQGRGAAANSAVCYCLGVTAVDPGRVELLFERFVSKERNEPPDIDIDFEHERREEVIQYLYRKYGRDRAALTAEVISYRPRSAVRDVGKALGLSLDLVDRLAKNLDWFDLGGLQPKSLRELGLDPSDPTLRKLAALVWQVQGFPRHLSQHVGGFVITRGPLCESVPIENAAMPDRTVIEWDKDDIDALGMLKVDVLGLGMLTCVRKTLELVEQHHGETLDLASIPEGDEPTYDMICNADTIGVFQIESRAQMSMLPRLQPRTYYDLVIEVAIVRPGPIQGDMVHPYLRRRNKEEPEEYPTPAVEKVLKRTLGVPLFQEQAMALAIEAAGFTPGEADQLRRAMASWKRKTKQILEFGRKLIDGMIARDYKPDFAERCFNQLKGFSEYGFPESHAASFALIVYASAYLKCHFPAAFACGLLNSQPMGFYAPAQIVRDAKEHGVEIRPIDANRSHWDCTLEGGAQRPALRLGLRMVKGLRQDEAEKIVRAVEHRGQFRDLESLWRRSGVGLPALRALASADAFGSLGLDRQAAKWHAYALKNVEAPLFERVITCEESAYDATHSAEANFTPRSESSALPPVPELRKVKQDYAATGLSLRRHPVAFLREGLVARGVITAAELQDESRSPRGRSVTVAGLVLLRQRPGTASGIVFMTLEDETGISNLIVRPHIFTRFRRAARHGVVLLVRGRVERQGKVVHVLVRHIRKIDEQLQGLDVSSRDFH